MIAGASPVPSVAERNVFLLLATRRCKFHLSKFDHGFDSLEVARNHIDEQMFIYGRWDQQEGNL